jgi:hypothetical protein
MKRLLLVILMLAVLLSFTTCKFFDSIFFTAPGVSPHDLAPYTGTTPSTRSDAMMSFGEPGLYVFMAMYLDMQTRPEFQDFASSIARVLLGNTPTGKLLQKSLAQKLARSITLSQVGLGSDISTNPDKEVHLDIEKETVINANVGPTATGTIVIDKCKFDLVGTANGLSSQHPPSSIDITQAEGDVSLSADNYKYSAQFPGVTLNTARIGLKVKGTGNATIDTTTFTPTSETYDLSLSLKAGISVSNSNSGAFSGKYIIELSYYDSGDLTASDFSSTDPYAAINKIKFTLTIALYDNGNKKLDDWTFDQSDLVDLLQNGVKGL